MKWLFLSVGDLFFFVGDLILRALLFEVYIRALIFGNSQIAPTTGWLPDAGHGNGALPRPRPRVGPCPSRSTVSAPLRATNSHFYPNVPGTHVFRLGPKDHAFQGFGAAVLVVLSRRVRLAQVLGDDREPQVGWGIWRLCPRKMIGTTVHWCQLWFFGTVKAPCFSVYAREEGGNSCLPLA